jgi:purine-binding chemotaxis protein CheW
MAEAGRIKDHVELATFYVGDALCGMDILQIQEVNKLMDMTEVPQAPEYVNGILNLRGQIVTIIDLGKKLGLGQTEISLDSRNIIVTGKGGEHIGLYVKKISDVVTVNPQQIESAPSNMNGIQGEFFTGVHKSEDKLVGILDVAKILGHDEDRKKVKN